MIHSCNIHCHTIDPTSLDSLAINDEGKWLPFTFLLDIVVAFKVTTDTEEDKLYNCTTLFTDHDNFVIDTPYSEFRRIYLDYYTNTTSSKTNKPSEPEF